MFPCRTTFLLVALIALAQIPAQGQGTPRRFWVCVGADGERVAKDRACSADEQTVSAPAGATPAIPGATQATAAQAGASPTARPRLTPADERPNPFQPIVDVAVRGFSLIALALLGIAAIKVLLTTAAKRATSGRRDHRARSQPARKDRSASKARDLSAPPSWDRHGIRPEPPTNPLPPPTPPSPGARPLSLPVAWSIALIRELEWKRFEVLCMQFWIRKGYPATLSNPGADGGVDVVIADQRDPSRIFAVAQCKSWSSKPVGVESVRALWGAKDHFGAQLALFYGLSGFTPDAKAFAEAKHLKLISGEDLLQQILSMAEPDQAALLTEVTLGDYTTPTCPSCDIKMQRREGKNGKPDFWGCNNFRRCGSRPIPCRN